MHLICAVGVCSSPKGTVHHRFPKDPKLRKLWVAACRRADDLDPDKCVVCTVHFKEEDYERDLKNELLNKPLRKILKPGVFPTLKLSIGNNILKRAAENSERKQRMAKKQRKELVDELLQQVNTLT